MIEVRLGTNWYVLRIILLELSRQNFLSPVTVPPKITVRELHRGLLHWGLILKFPERLQQFNTYTAIFLQTSRYRHVSVTVWETIRPVQNRGLT